MTEPRLRAALVVLALLGAGIAAYLTYTRYSGGAPDRLAGSGGCETVQRSEYAKLAGIPVAVLGLLGYAALLVTALLRGRNAAAAGAGIALVGAIFSAWLLYAQLALIDAICQWCIANDIVIALAAVVSVLRPCGKARSSAQRRPRCHAARPRGRLVSWPACAGSRRRWTSTKRAPRASARSGRRGGAVVEAGCGLERLRLDLEQPAAYLDTLARDYGRMLETRARRRRARRGSPARSPRSCRRAWGLTVRVGSYALRYTGHELAHSSHSPACGVTEARLSIDGDGLDEEIRAHRRGGLRVGVPRPHPSGSGSTRGMTGAGTTRTEKKLGKLDGVDSCVGHTHRTRRKPSAPRSVTAFESTDLMRGCLGRRLRARTSTARRSTVTTGHRSFAGSSWRSP